MGHIMLHKVIICVQVLYARCAGYINNQLQNFGINPFNEKKDVNTYIKIFFNTAK